MSKKGLLVVFTGPSGCGKGTIMKQLLDRYDDIVLSVSMTTRKPRPGEIDGFHYHFVTHEQFEKLIADDAFLEYAKYNDNYYGTPSAPIQKLLDEGKNVMLEIEVQGGEKVMDKCPDAVSVFVDIPSFEELERRLRGRGTETEDVIQGRLKSARYELSRVFRYQYVVLNDDVEAACNRVRAIIEAEHMRYSRMKNSILEVN